MVIEISIYNFTLHELHAFIANEPSERRRSEGEAAAE